LTVFKDELAADQPAMKCVEIGIVTFGPVTAEAQVASATTYYLATL